MFRCSNFAHLQTGFQFENFGLAGEDANQTEPTQAQSGLCRLLSQIATTAQLRVLWRLFGGDGDIAPHLNGSLAGSDPPCEGKVPTNEPQPTAGYENR